MEAAFFISLAGVCINTKQSVVPRSVFLVQIVTVVRNDGFDVQFFCDFQKPVIRNFFFPQAMLLKFQIIIIPENGLIILRKLISLFVFVINNRT